ncbi:hypothetical protein M408DRAFT_191198 [Serendipita vermifera MAFF 305830]|uniref:Uncharacterized protein n=1 Tax=Serendipita vermifera MAFF 305830 TaxID=933852 RepID=A0A0C3B8A6_SERVB|nr:hypothetical protein M408DRAFT_191198 [Serendipita vermifera MAFF 305830]
MGPDGFLDCTREGKACNHCPSSVGVGDALPIITSSCPSFANVSAGMRQCWNCGATEMIYLWNHNSEYSSSKPPTHLIKRVDNMCHTRVGVAPLKARLPNGGDDLLPSLSPSPPPGGRFSRGRQNDIASCLSECRDNQAN